MQRTSDDMEDRLDVSELIERITAERGLPVEITGRHRLLLDPDTRRSRRRRLAPAVAGVTTVLVATTIAVTLRPGDTPAGPSLDAALVGASSAEPTTEPSPTGDPVDEALPAPDETVHRPGANRRPRRRAAPPRRRPPSRPPPPSPRRRRTTARRPPPPRAGSSIDRDEFTGTAISDRWGQYDGPGNNDKGRRTPDAQLAAQRPADDPRRRGGQHRRHVLPRRPGNRPLGDAREVPEGRRRLPPRAAAVAAGRRVRRRRGRLRRDHERIGLGVVLPAPRLGRSGVRQEADRPDPVAQLCGRGDVRRRHSATSTARSGSRAPTRTRSPVGRCTPSSSSTGSRRATPPSPRSSRSTGCGSTSRANHFSHPPRPELPTGRGGVVPAHLAFAG